MVVESLLLLARVVDESVAVPVEVAARPLEERVGSLLGSAGGVGNAVRVLDALEAAVGGVKTRQGNPAKCLAIAARLNTHRVLVVDSKVADVAVTAEDGNGSVAVDLADGLENRLQGVGVVVLADRIVTNQHEEVDGVLGVEGVVEPLLLDHVLGLDDLRGVGVA